MRTRGERLYARIRECKANAYISDDGKLMLKNPHRLSKELQAYIGEHADDLMAHVELLRDEFEERAAIVEEGAKVPRAVAEEFARLLIYAIPDAPEADQAYLVTQACRNLDEVVAPYVEEQRRAA